MTRTKAVTVAWTPAPSAFLEGQGVAYGAVQWAVTVTVDDGWRTITERHTVAVRYQRVLLGSPGWVAAAARRLRRERVTAGRGYYRPP